MLLLTHYGLDADKIINELKEITKRGSNTLQKKVTDAIKIIAELEKYNDKDAQDLIAILQAQVSRAKTMIGEPQNLRNNPTNIQSKTPEENSKKANKIIAELTKIIDNVLNNPLKPIEMLQKNLKAIYFPEQPEISNEDVLQRLTQATFNPFPRLKYVLEQVYQGHADIQIPEELKDAEPQVSFQSLNTTYGYFNTDLSPLFNQLVVACHKMTTLIEHQAFDPEMAYKLMALFYDPQKSQDENAIHISQKFSTLMSTKQDKTIQHPYHDAFVTILHHFPIFRNVKELQSWQDFIAKEGFNSLAIFAQCAHLQPAFENIKEAQDFLLKQKYPRANEHPELAKLCKKLLIDNSGFEAGLNEVKTGWPKKETDNLPLVDIADETGQYFWVKLRPQDMRALYLGNLIPGCCQHIGGHSEQCVKDGIALSDNGFYVLLKAKKEGSNEPRIINNEVNDKHYDIVAQSYAWKSNNGNLCLDSIEWNKQRVTTHIIQDLMSKFSETVFEEHPSIKHITAGAGGQTPRGIYPACTINETMKQGYMYGDSRQQFLLSSNIPSAELAALKERLKSYEPEVQNTVKYLAPYFSDIDKISNSLLRVNSNIALELPQFMERINLPAQLAVDDFKTLSFKYYEQMEPSEQAKVSTVCKIFNSQTEADLLRWLPTIPKKDLSLISFRNKDYSTNFLMEYIKQCPPEQRLELINEKNRDGNSVLTLARNDAKLLKQILELLPPEQKLNVVKKKNVYGENFLFHAVSNPELFKSILELYPEDERFEAIKLKNKFGETVLFRAISDPDLFKSMLELIPAEKRLEAVKSKNTDIIKAGLILPEFLEYHPYSELLEMMEQANNNSDALLFEAISNPPLLKSILECLPEEIAFVFKTHESELKSNFNHILGYASSIEQFMKDMQELAPPESIKAFVQAIIRNDDIHSAKEALFKTNSSPSFYKLNHNQAIQQCIEKLDSYWLSRIQPKPPEPSQLNQR